MEEITRFISNWLDPVTDKHCVRARRIDWVFLIIVAVSVCLIVRGC